jgi:hypothetical protein
MVGVVQWSEHWTVAPGVGGSSPLAHPKLLTKLPDAPVAQLDRASASGAEGRRFESSQARKEFFGGVQALVIRSERKVDYNG